MRWRDAGDSGGGSAAGSSGTLNKASLYALLKTILQSSERVHIEADDPHFRLTLSLTDDARVVLEGAVQVDGIDLSGRDLAFYSDGGSSIGFTMPGITTADEGSDLGQVDTVEKLNFTGAGVTATRVPGSTETTVNIPGATPGSGGVSLAQVDGRIDGNPRVTSLSRFEAALRKTTVISGPAAFTVASPNAAVAISGSVPGAEADRELVVAVTGSPTQTFQLSSFAGKNAAAAAITLTDANSVKWMAGTVTYRLGHTAAGGFVASASTAATYTITLTDSRIDLEGWARLNGGQIPANRLPNGGGLTQRQVDARIDANPRVTSLSHFEAALRKTTVISGPAAFTVASPNAAVAISGSVPGAEADRELVVAVTGSPTQTFQLSSFAGKNAAAAAITLTDANSVKWMAGTVTYRLGHTAAGGFVASASTAATYTITLTDSRIDLETWARRNGEQIPANRLPNGGGLTQGQVDARIDANPRVTSLSRFEAALRKTTVISGPAAFTVASPNAAVAISGSVPGAEADRELVVAVAGSSTQTFQLSSFAGKDAAAAAITLTDANSVKWMAGTVTYRLGHTAAGGFVASASTAGTYTITLTDSRIDLETWARRNGEQIPANRLPNGGGLTQGQVDARIESFARAGTTTRVPESHLPTDLDHLLDALADGGWSTEGNNAAEDAWIAQVASPTEPTIGAARGYTYASATWERTGSTITPAWLTVRVPAGLKDEVAAGNLRLIADYNNDPDDMGDVAVSSGWIHVGNSTDDAYRYYIQRFTGVPAGTNIVQRYTRFRIDRTKLDTGVPAGEAGDDGKVLAYHPGGNEWEELPILHGIQRLHSGTIPGLSITNLGNVRNQTINLFSPAFDLDDNGRGEFHVQGVLTISTRSHSTVGWNDGGNDLSEQISGYVFASVLSAAADFVTAGAVEGVKVGKVDLYKGSAKQGEVSLWLVHNSDNHVGAVLDYEPETGASSTDNITLGAQLQVSFAPSDPAGGASATRGRGRLIATATLPAVAGGTDFIRSTTWAVESAFSTEYNSRTTDGSMFPPNFLPANQLGFINEVKDVNDDLLYSFYLPWSPPVVSYRNTTAGVARTVYLIPLPYDSTLRSVNQVFQMRLKSSDVNKIFFNATGKAFKAGIKVELYEWLA